ncbi:plasmid pRiA4b ORF-3 family protein [Bacillus sp. KH172YL63]|uniref:plasmid pRiA4b ORF-3 family protein n=1 Tax=Bacillus sp. KH172YL63 TaxID=2709784 RepID=UPI0013E4E301|nr:plasmid pRiA4b ORF-3 family protein [Bacillus sp. KH172YL63]BCB05823.1 hypothetical protein KH172YL63_39560 [Bacillus sp. KH172YL63]
MLIQCTKKLLDELKVTPVTEAENVNPLVSWHANIVKNGRYKFLVLVNDQNRYAIVLYGLKAKDRKNIQELIVRAMREVFRGESISDQVIDEYLSGAPDITFAKTKDRKLVARLNKACESVHFAEKYWEPESIVQVKMSRWISSLLVGDGGNSYFSPNEAMYKALEEMTGKPVFDRDALVLKVTLDLQGHSVWRKIRVPANTTFRGLHTAIQAAFGWYDSHLHDFTVYEKRKDGSITPSLELVCEEEALTDDCGYPVKMETDYQVKPFLSERIIYTYDFGDNWEHLIELEEVLHDVNSNDPICLDGEGNAPPEDVGSEPGYEQSLSIIQDPAHPEHEEMKEWGKMQGYEEFDLKEINWRMKMG